MTEMDYGAFEAAMKRLSGAYQMRVRPAEWAATVREYFDALKHASLHDVLAAQQACRDTLKRFPRIVEWRAELPVEGSKPTDARLMRHDEALEYLRAERQAFEDDPCFCLACQAADVTERPLRYVPDFTDTDREERAWNGLKDAMVTVGHWAHGDELARWYAARARFYGAGAALRPFARVLQLIGAEREPGQEG